MDPLQPPPQPPAGGATTEQPQNHITDSANPPAPPAHTHPPYAEMIYAAITALKERDGSSKRAIAKYIERAYTGLPPTHSALLTHHLKRLKLKGLLVMVKKSYKLPRSDASPGNSNPLPDSSSTSGAKQGRGRGRPPKPKPVGPPNGHPDTQPNTDAQPNTDTQPTTDVQPYSTGSMPNSNMLLQLQPVLVSVGLVDEPVATARRGPGRPRKTGLVGQVGGLGVAKRGRGKPPGSGPKKAPGRPRKPKSVTAVLAPKRGPGRPPKTVVVPYASPLPSPVKARGRPKKVADGGEMVPIQAPERGEMEPRKRPGRPPKVGGPMKMTPRKSTGRPVGRPKKISSSLIAEASQLQAETQQDLRRKLEFLQLKVKQAVGVLKPQLTGESAISAVAAIQELEGLASMDINTMPLREEVQAQQVAQTLPLTTS